MNIPNDQPIVPPEPVQLQPQPQLQPQMQWPQPQPQLHPQIQSQRGEVQPQIRREPDVQQPEPQSQSERLAALQPRVRPQLQTQGQAQPQEPYTADFVAVSLDVPADPLQGQVQLQPQPQPQPQAQPQVPYPADSIVVSPAASSPQGPILIESSNNEAGRTFSNSGFTELQEHAKLACSRVRLMDSTIDILLLAFQNKYELNKELEKRCAKLFTTGTGTGADRASLDEDLGILTESDQWVKDHLLQLDVCLSEKRRNMQIAGPLIDERQEKRREDEQERKIARIARKVEERAIRWTEKEEKRKRKEKEMLENVEMKVMQN